MNHIWSYLKVNKLYILTKYYFDIVGSVTANMLTISMTWPSNNILIIFYLNTKILLHIMKLIKNKSKLAFCDHAAESLVLSVDSFISR